ncbi:glycosyltransferase family 4 protein [uncultured Microbulbifer sp.]|uniref:glycosyltransferase family 4 protein n=1 Tax=uncultured Microbulbifer sp. TaxID=348147 RepID=UPI0026093A29|nr:glycosyltransferase family 4 protein [uncultured Microbulbifer sp.]
MKIVLIGTAAGSMIGFRAHLIKSLVAKGHHVFAFALDYTKETKLIMKKFGAKPVDYVFNRTGLNPFDDLRNMFKLAVQLKEIKPHLVFSYFSKPVIFGTFAAALAGVDRRVAMLEGLGFVFTDQPEGIPKKTQILRKIQVFLYRLSFLLLENIIFLNLDDPKDLITKHSIKVKNVDVLGGIGLDLSLYPYVKPDPKKIAFLFVGRLLKEKGINEFIAAARMVKQQYPDVTFTVLGGLDEDNPGGLKSAELNRLTECGVIDYLGYVTNVAERMAECSVFVLPSFREGVPRSTQEAMAIGRPVITTDVPGCRETVIDGVNGFMVPPWQPKCLANKMTYFIEHPEQIAIMGLESYKFAQEKFDAEIVNRKLINMLDL